MYRNEFKLNTIYQADKAITDQRNKTTTKWPNIH